MKTFCDFVAKTIGVTSDFPIGAQISIQDEKKIESSFQNLSEKERLLLRNAISAFWIYARDINSLRESPGVWNSWVNFMLIVLFGLVESVMGKHKDLRKYLQGHKGRVDIGELLKDYDHKHGSSQKVRSFFDQYILKSEKEDILEAISKDKEWKGVKDIGSFIRRIVRLRSRFVHNLDLPKISAFDIRLKVDISQEKNFMVTGWVPTLSIDRITHYVLMGVFRRFDLL